MPNQQFFILFYWQNGRIGEFFIPLYAKLWIIAYSAFFHKNSEWKCWFSHFFIFLYENLPIQHFFFTKKNSESTNIHIILLILHLYMKNSQFSVFFYYFIEKKLIRHILKLILLKKTPNYQLFFHFLYEKIGNFFTFLWKSAESALFLIILLKNIELAFFLLFLWEKHQTNFSF